MKHIKYPKIYRIGKDETDWLLNEDVIVQEKIDWANLSIRMDDGEIYVWSRTQIVWHPKADVWFNWAVEYVKSHEGIRKLLTDNPTRRLFGERLVKHTIEYPPQYYNKFRMFDIMTNYDEEQEYPEFLNPQEVYEIAEKHWIESPKIYHTGKTTEKDIESYAKETVLWDKTEWVVIKSCGWINRFGRHCYGKFVTDQFIEQNSIAFGSTNKYMEKEHNISMKFCTPARFKKIVHKIEQDKWEDFSKKNIAEIIGRMNYDILTEEVNEICQWVVDFGKLRKKITERTRIMALQYVEWSLVHVFNLNKEDEESNTN